MRGYAAPEGLMSFKTASRPISLGWLLLEPGASYRAKPWVARLPPRARRKASPKATSTVAPRLAGDCSCDGDAERLRCHRPRARKERAMLRSGLADIESQGELLPARQAIPAQPSLSTRLPRLSPAFLRCLMGGASHV